MWKSCVTPSNSATVGPTQMFWPPPLAAGFIGQQQQHWGDAQFSPLVDMSTPSGMHNTAAPPSPA